MLDSEIPEQTPKELLKRQLRSLDPDFRYYKSLFNATSDLIAVTDGNTVLDANAAFVRFFAALGIDVHESTFSLPHVFEKVDKYGYVYEGYESRRWFETIFRGEKEHYRVAIAGTDKRYDFNITIQMLEPAEDIFVTTLTDVSEMMGYKTTLEEGIKSSVQDRDNIQFLLRQYNQAIEAATMVYKLDLQGTITYVNKALSEVLLYTNGELLGKHASILQAPNSDGTVCDAIWGKVSKGEIYHGIAENRDKKGGLHYFDLSVIPIYDNDKNLIECLALEHEVTEVIRAKEAAVQTLEAKTKFFDQISHELRTPLNAVVNFTDQALENFDEMFEDEILRDLVKIYLVRAYKNSQNLLHLINSLLDMAKLQSGKETFAMERYDAVKLVRETYENCSGLYTNSNVEYRLKANISFVWINCDPFKFRQIITNLISNAFKFTQSGFIEIRVDETDSECLIEIEDTGFGIPADKLSTIFEAFQQARAHDQGTGLGLNIVREYADAMDIALNIHSVENQGSCFTLKAKKILIGESTAWSI